MEVESRVPAINIEAAQKVIQQQLVLLLHAHSCEQKQQREEEPSECNLPYCKETKQVIHHIRGCSDGRECTVDQCNASLQIISHWKHCAQKKRCPVCGPVFHSQISNALNSMPH